MQRKCHLDLCTGIWHGVYFQEVLHVGAQLFLPDSLGLWVFTNHLILKTCGNVRRAIHFLKTKLQNVFRFHQFFYQLLFLFQDWTPDPQWHWVVPSPWSPSSLWQILNPRSFLSPALLKSCLSCFVRRSLNLGLSNVLFHDRVEVVVLLGKR